MFLYATTIFVSAFLLFLVQPIIAKQILPWFGGSASVWTTCLCFFNCALLAGYFYSDFTTRKLSRRNQAYLHIALLVIALALLPITPAEIFKPVGDEAPSLRIILVLAATIGLPYFLLSTTSPLVQAWFAQRYPQGSAYRLFALSNLASMLALLGYPFLIEPWFSTRVQAWAWSGGFGLFAILVGFCAWRGLQSGLNDTLEMPENWASSVDNLDDLPLRKQLTWVLLSALGTILLLTISNHLTQNISSIPLLWVVPLSLYLLTFILCFDSKGWYVRPLFLTLLGAAIVAMGWFLADKELHFLLYWQIGVFCAGLFFACMVLHGELVRLKPPASQLTRFYLMVSVGGALGAMLVSIVAPMVLPAYFELEIALVLLSVVVTALLLEDYFASRKAKLLQLHESDPFAPAGKLPIAWPQLGAAVVGGAITVFAIGAAATAIQGYFENVVVMKRNFYGSMRVKESVSNGFKQRSLVHGSILHGTQFTESPNDKIATTYYKEKSGIGRAILLQQKLEATVKIGVIGLGTGTIAAYGNKGDALKFYDINQEVVNIANRDFSYLSSAENRGASTATVLGDARLTLEREPAQEFDVLAIDAFSSDSIPVHLITNEAVGIYLRHMKPNGIIAFHVSNRFLDLKPVVQQIADKNKLHASWVRDVYDDGSTSSDWVLLSRNPEQLKRPEIAEATAEIIAKPEWRLWTDDFNNLLQVLK